jgi:hypothetical protein
MERQDRERKKMSLTNIIRRIFWKRETDYQYESHYYADTFRVRLKRGLGELREALTSDILVIQTSPLAKRTISIKTYQWPFFKGLGYRREE